MGSSASKRATKNKVITITDEPKVDPQRKILLQRKVTIDILEKLSRCLPTVTNPLGKTLGLTSESNQMLEWNENLNYLQEWKRTKKDDATIGNLIELLKKADHSSDQYQCLFNISREPRNASTVTERVENDHVITSRNINRIDSSRAPYRVNLLQPIPCSEDLPSDEILQEHHSELLTHLFELMHQLLQNTINAVTSQLCKQLDELTFCWIEFHRPPTHDWLDFRSLHEVDQSWYVIDSSMLRNGNVGNYLPGITQVKDEIVVSDVNKKSLHFFNKFGSLLRSISTEPNTPGGMCHVSHDKMAVCCGREVSIWNRDGQKKFEFGKGVFGWCRGICFDRNNRFIISDIANKSVTIHGDTGQLLANVQLRNGESFDRPYHVAVDHKNNILVCDSTKNFVHMFDKNGLFARTLIRSSPTNKLQSPMGMETDCCGNLLLASYGENRISLFNSEGWFLRALLTSSHMINQPVTLSVTGPRKLVVSLYGKQPLQMFQFV